MWPYFFPFFFLKLYTMWSVNDGLSRKPPATGRGGFWIFLLIKKIWKKNHNNKEFRNLPETCWKPARNLPETSAAGFQSFRRCPDNPSLSYHTVSMYLKVLLINEMCFYFENWYFRCVDKIRHVNKWDALELATLRYLHCQNISVLKHCISRASLVDNFWLTLSINQLYSKFELIWIRFINKGNGFQEKTKEVNVHLLTANLNFIKKSSRDLTK